MHFQLHQSWRSAFSALLIISLLAGASAIAQNAPAAAPKFLFDVNPAHSAGKIVDAHASVTATPRNGGIDVVVAGSSEGYPGFAVAPSKGEVWDLAPWGNVQARVTNTGAEKLSVSLRVDNVGDWKDDPWNTESVSLKPGETGELKVIFGYHYGYKPGYKLKSDAVNRVLIFVGKSAKERSFRIEELQASGAAGDKPPVDPNAVVERPQGGLILGAGAQLVNAAKFEVKGGARADWSKSKTLILDIDAGKQGSLTLKPGMGVWDLGLQHEVKVTLRNLGGVAILPSLRVESRSGATETVASVSPIAPGTEITLTASFVPTSPWVGVPDPKPGHSGGIKGTGTLFESNRANGITILVEAAAAAARMEIAGISATATPAILPPWVGKRPPVDGDWKLTLEDNFDGNAINLSTWNIYTSNFWDKRTHFSRDNTLVKEGKLVLRYEKKSGFHNDDPEDKSAVAKTDFACGFADTYGKWTQRYGYFEARMKLPTAHGLWPAFWMMPDRGGDPDPTVNPQWKRAGTGNDGMEFDIMEHLSGWGPYRFNMAFHWDGYGKEHKAVGTSNAYVPADTEGFITIGMLWTPGCAVYYGNGKEIGRWESERIGSVQSYPILYMVSGGWANTPLDPTQLPADFVIDYIRVWQRSDLASPEDGPKPNSGAPKSQF
ncbi:MAG: glycoside hydrolase family 16 protein [Kiritimatiellae bacterium]|nr:glycoside hydrolase family 16 protein [Kiritimatiellia bacterium]